MTANKSKYSAAAPAELVAEDMGDQEMQIDLAELFCSLLDKAWIIVLVGLLGAMLAGVYTYFFVEETYTATTKLYVIGENSAIDLTQLNFGDKLADDYVEVFRNRDVHSSVQAYLAQEGYELPDYRTVQRSMTVSQLSNTRILSISYTSENRDEALRIVEAYAKAAISFISSRMGAERPPTEFEKPYVSTNPANLVRNTVLGLVVGGMAIVAILTILYILDDRIRTSEQLERKLGIPALGLMPIQTHESRSHKRRKEAKV